MKKTALLLFLMSFQVFADIDCSKHPIFCQITKNQPRIDKKYAMKLSNIVYKMHKKYHIPSRIFTAILMQESGYSLKAKGCHFGMRQMSEEEIQWALNKPNADIIGAPIEMVEDKICTDFGISQIYYKTAKRYGFDIEMLTKNLEYSVEAGAKVLHGFMEKYEAKDNDWWVRYNCGSRGTTKRDTCQIYKKLVERYL